MTGEQAVWIARCREGNEPRNRVVVHLRPADPLKRLLVEVRECLPSRERCVAVVLLGGDGKPL